jgi:hypothetical protein
MALSRHRRNTVAFTWTATFLTALASLIVLLLLVASHNLSVSVPSKYLYAQTDGSLAFRLSYGALTVIVLAQVVLLWTADLGRFRWIIPVGVEAALWVGFGLTSWRLLRGILRLGPVRVRPTAPSRTPHPSGVECGHWCSRRGCLAHVLEGRRASPAAKFADPSFCTVTRSLESLAGSLALPQLCLIGRGRAFALQIAPAPPARPVAPGPGGPWPSRPRGGSVPFPPGPLAFSDEKQWALRCHVGAAVSALRDRTHDLSRVNPSWVVSVTWGSYGKSSSEGK